MVHLVDVLKKNAMSGLALCDDTKKYTKNCSVTTKSNSPNVTNMLM
jgi:hypothetical protein